MTRRRSQLRAAGEAISPKSPINGKFATLWAQGSHNSLAEGLTAAVGAKMFLQTVSPSSIMRHGKRKHAKGALDDLKQRGAVSVFTYTSYLEFEAFESLWSMTNIT